MRALALVVLLSGCTGARSDDFSSVARTFAERLVAKDFTAAHAMLAAPPALTREALETQYTQMVEPIGAVSNVHVTQTMTDWPAKQATDAGWAYVAIEGASGSEAVTVVVTRDRRIRTIEWGRP